MAVCRDHMHLYSVAYVLMRACSRVLPGFKAASCLWMPEGGGLSRRKQDHFRCGHRASCPRVQACMHASCHALRGDATMHASSC